MFSFIIVINFFLREIIVIIDYQSICNNFKLRHHFNLSKNYNEKILLFFLLINQTSKISNRQIKDIGFNLYLHNYIKRNQLMSQHGNKKQLLKAVKIIYKNIYHNYKNFIVKILQQQLSIALQISCQIAFLQKLICQKILIDLWYCFLIFMRAPIFKSSLS